MLAPTLLENYPEVETAGRIHRLFFVPEVAVIIEDESFQESRFYLADSLFLKVFKFDFIKGNPETALNGPGKVIITKSTALKYFGGTEVLDSTFQALGSNMQVSGIIKDIPANSHMQFDLLGSISTIGYLENAIQTGNWTSPWLYTYVKLKKNTSSEEFQLKLNDIVKDFGAANIQREVGISIKEYMDSGHQYNYFLQPLTAIHLKSNLDVELQPNSNIMYVYMLSLVVIFILLISCINFINLSTARSSERAREVGIRKVMGSLKGSLISQFLSEAILMALISLVLGVILVWMTLPIFNEMVNKSFGMEMFSQPLVVIGLLIFATLVGIISGVYPAFVVSSIKPAVVLKGDFKSSSKGIWLRNGLVVFQFFISIVLVSGTLMVERQLSYIQNKNLGFEKENILVLKQTRVLGESWTSFRDELMASPNIEDVGATFLMPGEFFGSNIYQPDDPELPMLRANTLTIGDNYLRAMKIEVEKGRYFSEDFNDSLNCVINEAAAKVLGWDDPIGHTLTASNSQDSIPAPGITIVGVLKDFNFQSLHSEIFPLVLFNGNSGFVPGAMAVRIAPGDIEERISTIRTKWNEMETDQDMVFSFLDDDLNALYESEQTSRRIFNAFASIAIIMACVGLFGLATYVAQQRTKEIGIRKVMGASVLQIILLLSRDLSKMIAVSFVIAIPIAFLGMEKWLQIFAFRTTIGPGVFILAGLITTFLAWLTISFHSVKSALRNPIDSIRNE
jgi:putative ABC transport system permease protein